MFPIPYYIIPYYIFNLSFACITSGVQECRSDASLRSVDDNAACMVCFVCNSRNYRLISCYSWTLVTPKLSYIYVMFKFRKQMSLWLLPFLQGKVCFWPFLPAFSGAKILFLYFLRKKMPDNLQDSKSRSTFASLLKGSPPPKEFGKVVEWSITAVLKTAVLRGTGGSNPSLSATERDEQICSSRFFLCFKKVPNYIGPVRKPSCKLCRFCHW